mgnify:CR=1 FL=1
MLLLLRVIKYSIQDIFRNFSLSCMTVLILVLMLLSVNTLAMIRALTTQATLTVLDQIDVSIFLRPDVPQEKITEIREYLQTFPEVTELTYISRDEVLAQFEREHADNPDIIASLQELGTNPLGATFVVKTQGADDYQKIIDALGAPEYADSVEGKTFANTEAAIQRIHLITTLVEQFSLALSGLFALIAFLIIFNTIRIAIYTQRIEISIKRLV